MLLGRQSDKLLLHNLGGIHKIYFLFIIILPFIKANFYILITGDIGALCTEPM